MSTTQQKSHWGIITAFMLVPLITSVVSTIHVVSFFELSNYYILSLVLALAFELGALSALAGLVVMDKINKSVIWFIFILLTAFQMIGNTYFAYDTTTTKMLTETNLIKNFSELFGFVNENHEDAVFIKRMIAVLTGGVLPVISLSFLHLLMSYISKLEINTNTEIEIEKKSPEPIVSTFVPEPEQKVVEVVPELVIEPANIVVEPKNDEPIKENFDDYLEKKKRKLEEDRRNYFPLLNILFKKGTAKEGEELPSFSELTSIREVNIYPSDVLKMFLILCNFLDITKVSGEIRRALKSYEDAKKTLEDYLSFDYEVKNNK